MRKLNEDGKALGGKKEWPGALGVSLVRNAGFPKKICTDGGMAASPIRHPIRNLNYKTEDVTSLCS